MSIYFPDYSDGSLSPSLLLRMNFPVSVVPDFRLYPVRVKLLQMLWRRHAARSEYRSTTSITSRWVGGGDVALRAVRCHMRLANGSVCNHR
jgi:hypothetical protein